MSQDFDQVVDFEIESRLRRLGRAEPPVPARVYRFVAEVAGEAAPTAASALRLEPVVLRPAFRGRGNLPRALVGVAAALTLLLAGSALLLGIGRPNNEASILTPAPGLWTGLEWTEITDGSFAASAGQDGNVHPISVASWHGTIYAASNGTVLTSSNGTKWQRAELAPSLQTLVATDGWLLGLNSGSFEHVGPDGEAVVPSKLPSAVSMDGTHWVTSSAPAGVIAGVVALHDRALILTQLEPVVVAEEAGNASTEMWPGALWLSENGRTWTRVAMPGDMAGAVDLSVSALREGFVVSGSIVDPTGPSLLTSWSSSNGGSGQIMGYVANWFSSDGVNWRRFPSPIPTRAGSDAAGPHFAGLSGAQGDLETSSQLISTDGTQWRPGGPEGFVPTAVATTNGSQIVQQAAGPRFYVGLGNGLWTKLPNYGDVPYLWDGGVSWAVAGGILYAANDHFYFGRGMTEQPSRSTLPPGPRAPVPSSYVVATFTIPDLSAAPSMSQP